MKNSNTMAIIAEKIAKKFQSDIYAVRDLDLCIPEGEIFGLLGPNGAGKTTTIRMLNGTLVPTQGLISILGLPSSNSELRKLTGTLTDTAQMYDNLTVEDNLRFYSQLYELTPTEERQSIARLLSLLNLEEKRNSKLGTLSTGLKKRTQIARTLLHNPKLIFWDEPTSGLDPVSALQVSETMKNIVTESGMTVILCTHDLTLAEKVCNRFGFIKKGQLIDIGSKMSLEEANWKKKCVSIKTDRNFYEFQFTSITEINPLVHSIISKNETILDLKLNKPTLEEIYVATIERGNR